MRHGTSTTSSTLGHPTTHALTCDERDEVEGLVPYTPGGYQGKSVCIQVAHNGTYALAERVDEGAHIAGYALPEIGL